MRSPSQLKVKKEDVVTHEISFENGNKIITLRVRKGEVWEKEDRKRIYYTVTSDQKRDTLANFYEVLSGTTRDSTLHSGGRIFGFAPGVDINSHSKKEKFIEAMKNLVQKIVTEGNNQ